MVFQSTLHIQLWGPTRRFKKKYWTFADLWSKKALLVQLILYTSQQKSNHFSSWEGNKPANFRRYILEGDYQTEPPFICRENAHLDITFSCVAVLNSCVSLFPDNSTETERGAIIVRGFHGLLIYADMFWYKHLLTYFSLLSQREGQINTELLAQLQFLLRFRKDDSGVLPLKSKAPTKKDGAYDSTLEALNHLPDVKSLVSYIKEFRAKMALEQASDKSPEGRLFLVRFNRRNLIRSSDILWFV